MNVVKLLTRIWEYFFIPGDEPVALPTLRVEIHIDNIADTSAIGTHDPAINHRVWSWVDTDATRLMLRAVKIRSAIESASEGKNEWP